VRRWLWVLRTLPAPARRWALRRLFEVPSSRQRRLGAALAGAQGRRVFVCHGNIMRSAFATEIARDAQPALAPRIVGAGTHATTGRAAQDSALRVAPAFGVSLHGHTATSLQVAAIGAHDVVVCMDVMNEANVLASGVPAERVFLVGDVLAVAQGPASDGPANDGPTPAGREVLDPYGKGDSVTHDAFGALAQLARHWAGHFAAGQRKNASRFMEGDT
jgi:protein-tyrosine-phosphatase